MIKKLINSYRIVKANKKFIKNISNVLSIYIITFTVASLLEYFLYFNQTNREKIFFLLQGIFALSIIFLII